MVPLSPLLLSETQAGSIAILVHKMQISLNQEHSRQYQSWFIKGIIMGLRENLGLETVRRLELRRLITATPDMLVRDAIQLMRKHDIGCVVVVDEEGKPDGIFTESLLRHLILSGSSFLDEPLKGHMADRCPWVKMTDPIQTVLEAMQINNIRFICVVDEEGKACALTGQKGLMEYIAEHYPRVVMVQRITPIKPVHKREGA